MATDFIMPRIPTATRDAFYQQPHLRHPQQQMPAFHQQYTYTAPAINSTAASNFASQYNPQISPLSTSNSGSPNSPKPISNNGNSSSNSNNNHNGGGMNYHTRQVRPLYIPAVLRPNEHPSREGQTKARAASDNNSGNSSAIGDSGDDLDDQDDDSQSSRRSGGLRSSGSFISLPGLGAFGIGRLSRRSTNDSGKCVDSSWNLDQFPDVTGVPSRSHWKPDTESTMCDEPTCKKSFNYFTRRHHCRRCGNIFCDFHSAFEIPLDEKANYNPKGSSNRACAYCFREFRAWRTRANSSDLSGTSSGNTTPSASDNGKGANAKNAALKKSATAPTSPVMALAAAGRPGAPGTPTMAKVPDVAQSVPGDWNWSTF
ncbi:Zn finger protein [Sporothrix curviconia]|uniref:Zn finger protein n=1 Tax=Sporothrix curviconia TaxID=1260050 RepID=A0ABP0BS09_9PEZI